MSRNRVRPLSPHLTIWRWGPHMLVSILHRATGTGLAIAGGLLFVWWLMAAASGKEAYDTFHGYATWWPGYVVAIGLTWSFFQHMCSGIRHFVMDAGAGFELKTNRFWARMTIVGSVLLTAVAWGYVYARAQGMI